MHQGLGATSVYGTQVKDLIKDQVPITVNADMKVEDAAQILIKHGISSAPVISSNKFVGMFDYQDLVVYLLNQQTQTIKEGEEIDAFISRTFNDVRSVADLSRNDPLCKVEATTTLEEVLDIFSKDVHRVVVMDGSSLVGILTQSNVAAYLVHNKEVQEKLQQPLEKAVTQNFRVIDQDSSTHEAMKLMVDSKLTSLPIANKAGHLVGSVSLSDIKYVLKHSKHTLLLQGVFQFISHVRSAQGIEAGRDSFPVFDVRPTDSLGLALGKMVATKSHRVWVVDSQIKCIGVVSLTSALSQLRHK